MRNLFTNKLHYYKLYFLAMVSALCLIISQFSLISQTGPNDDFDGDGVVNSLDLDDDNDGILDTDEMVAPNCNPLGGTGATLRGLSWDNEQERTLGIDLSYFTGKNSYQLVTGSGLTKVTGPAANGRDWAVTGADNDGTVADANAKGDYQYGQFTVGNKNLIVDYWSYYTIQSGETMGIAFDDDIVNFATPVVAATGSTRPPGVVPIPVVDGYSFVVPNSKRVLLKANTTYQVRFYNLGTVPYFAHDHLGFAFYEAEAGCQPDGYSSQDLDNDGMPNERDLDSDGDGCSDALEGGDLVHLSNIDTNGKILGAVDSNGVPIIVNYGGNADVDGFIGQGKGDSQNSANSTSCVDTDSDGIADDDDIDDDNDGILDSIEISACIVPVNNAAYKSTITATTGATVSTGSVGYTVNGAEVSDFYFNSQTLSNTNILTYQFPSAVNLKGFEVAVNNVFITSGSLVKVQGSNNGNTWTDLTSSFDPGAVGASSYGLSATTTQKFPFTSNTNKYVYYRLLGISGNISSGPWILETYFSPIVPTSCDLDGDGISNEKDLDSDGDGCSDAKEANVTPSASLQASGSLLSAKFVFTSPANDANTDGLFDGATQTFYSNFAVTNTVNSCIDFDNDGVDDLVDIDDDNDGVPDAVESPSCFYSADEAAKVISVTSSLTKYASYDITNSYDNNTSTFSGFSNNQDWVNKTIFEITPTLALPIRALTIDVGSYALSYNAASTFKLQGLMGSSWVDLSSPISNTGTNIILSIASTDSLTTYAKYRLVGVAGTNTWAYIKELKLVPSSKYQASSFPKSSCNADTDGDGILNHKDLDSDGDGCSDANEANATTSKTANYQFAGAVGTNGFINSLETTVDNGIINYISTYTDFALSNTYNTCADTDNDGVGDLIDIDDDNDGILDTIESPACSVFTNGSFETYTSCPNLSAAGTVNYATGWTTYGGLSNTYSQLMVADGTACTSNKPASTWPASTALTGGSNGKGWAGGHQGEDLQNVLSKPLPIGSYTLRFDAGNVIFSPYTNTVQTIKIYGLKSSDADFAEPSTQLLATVTVNNVISSSNQVWKEYLANITTTQVYDRIHLVFGNTRGDFSVQNTYTYIDNVSFQCFINNDTDGDGVTNEKDLDSDGDGCSDAFEAGATTNNTTNYQFIGSVGANGLVNSLETAVDNGVVNYNSTYTLYALDATLNVCADTDNDGIGDLVDIDDDNDGILDATESPSCFYTAADISQIQTISSELASYSSYVVSNAIDQSASTLNAFTPSVSWVGKELYKVSTPQAFPLSSMSLDLTTWAISNSASNTFKLQGSNDNSSWTDLSSAVSSTATTGTFVITNSLAPTTAFRYYRLIGVAGTSYYGGVSEIRLNVATTFNPSSYPKGGCTTDTDGDGKLNHLDLDSDGDGCSDAYEAGATTNTTANYQFMGSVGTNGLVNSLETAVDNGTLNYSSTYMLYAISSALNICADSDNDGIGDLIDIDDDNDGTLDAIESPSCFYTLSEASIIKVVSTSLANDDVVNLDLPFMRDGVITTVAASNNIITANEAVNGATVYTVEYSAPVKLTSLSHYGTTFGTSATARIEGSNNNVTWTSLMSTATAATATTNTFTVNQNNGFYKYYRIVKVAGTTTPAITTYEIQGVVDATGYIASSNPKTTCKSDTDGDGTPNHLDLDSDGDGCSDAKEAGATISNTPNYQFTGAVGTNGLVNGLETIADNGVINFSSTYTQYALNNALNVCADSDNDGIGDIIDIDDDNDGVLDTTEDCDASSVTNNQLNTLAKFTSAPTTISGDSQIGYSYTPTGISFNPSGTVGQHNGVALLGPFTSTGVSVTVSAIVRKDWGVSSYGGSVKGLFEILDNSQNVVGSLTWQDNSSNGSTDANNQTISFSGTVPTGNYYIRIKDNGSLSTSSGWGDDWAVKELTISTSKCNWDLDNDGIPNRLDLDSDGDGCSDAYESGATASVVPNYQFTGSVGSNGLVNSLETAVDNGVLNYTFTYSNAINRSIHTCPSCIAGTLAPVLSSTSKAGVCPSTTIDLTSITASNLPAGTVLSWHTGSVASGSNKVATPSTVSGGTYYASFFDSANNCYSPTTLVTATAASCASGVIDCSKTQLYPAPVVGVSGQKVLYVTVNVSASGCFSPVSVSGSGFSVANGVTQICTATTGIQQLSVPVYYNGSSLGTMNFTIGASGSCGADLTSSPKKAVVDMWTIECLPTQGPVLK